MRYVAVASPDYLAAYFPRGVNRAALAEAPTLVFNRKDRLQHHLLSKLTGADLTPPVHWIPSSYGFLTAALSGMGWGLVPATMADEQLASGRLKRLRRDALLDIQLYWQHWRLETPLMRDLTAAVIGASM
jgi:LysR family transcriptional regulator (chromosome initiation inhibitor)